MKYYKEKKEDKNYEDAKFILVGNKTDLIDEVNSEIETDEKDKINESEEKKIIKEEKDYNANENKDDDKEEKDGNNGISQELKEIKENVNETNKKERITIDFKEDSKTNNKNYFQEVMKKEKFVLSKEISGLNGGSLEELLNETVILLYKMVK